MVVLWMHSSASDGFSPCKTLKNHDFLCHHHCYLIPLHNKALLSLQSTVVHQSRQTPVMRTLNTIARLPSDDDQQGKKNSLITIIFKIRRPNTDNGLIYKDHPRIPPYRPPAYP